MLNENSSKMPDKAMFIFDLCVTGFISCFALLFSFTFIPIVVAVLNGIYIVSRIKRDVNKYHKGNFWQYLKALVKKN